MGIPQTRGDAFGVEFDELREPFDNSRLPNARISDEHDGISALAVAEDLHHLPQLLLSTDERWQLILASELIEADAEMLQIGRQFVATTEAFFPLLARAHARDDLLQDDVRVCAEPPHQLHGHAIAILEESDEEIRGVNLIAPHGASAIQRQLQDRATGRIQAYAAPGELTRDRQLLVQGADDGLRINVEALHDLVEE